jgi:hypothetical protein
MTAFDASDWREHGLIYDLNAPARGVRHSKLLTHASNPTAVHIQGDRYRVFYSGRDSENRSSIGAVDFDFSTFEIVADHKEPFAVFGPVGSFDHAGIGLGCELVRADGRHLCYMAWQTEGLQHWRGDIGVIRLSDELFPLENERGILLNAEGVDPISLSYPCIRQNERGYDMWYGSTETWQTANGEMLHTINHAFSTDGIHWTRTGCAVPYTLGEAQAFSRPTVWQDSRSVLHMWYSYRDGTGTPYRIGHAQRSDSRTWARDHDQMMPPLYCSQWDTQMACYPFVFEHNKRLIMLYNGDDFGKFGFGAFSIEL